MYGVPLIDEDEDGMSDSWEDKYGFDKSNHEDARLDADNDSLTNLEEFINQTNPRLFDTDGDSLSDGEEVHLYRTSPLNSDTDGDSIDDSVDAFPLDSNVAIDNDGDLLPDQWNESCDLTCQNDAGLQLDHSLNDIDNDGLSDSLDTDNTRDSQPPSITAPPDVSMLTTGFETIVDLGQAKAEDMSLIHNSAPTRPN